MVERILNKPGVCKGEQFILVSVVDKIWLCAYVHQYKLW